MTVWGKRDDTKAKDQEDAGVPDFVSRIARSFGNPLVLKPFARPARIKSDSSGLVPGITEGGVRECPKSEV